MDALQQPLIAVRIKDGIFVGNVTAAHDEDFLFMNKVTGIVNCAGAEVRDLYESQGIKYLNFPWKDSSGGVCTTVMFDSGDRNIDQAVRFIDQCLETGECVLVHSYYGVSRSCALVAAYLMVKYGWRLDNALQFLSMAHPDTNIKPYFVRQLRTFAKRHNTEVDVFHEDVDDSRFGLDNDQWMLRNTLLNGLTADAQQRNPLYKQCSTSVAIQEANYKNPMKRRRRLVFVDTKQGTSVAGGTTPVVQPKPHYVDPMSGNFSGKMGVQALRSAAQPEAILARRGTPNSRKLESPPDSQPKGRQVLFIKTPQAPEQQQQQQQQHPTSHAATPSTASYHQSLAPGQYQLDRREQITVHNRDYAMPSPRAADTTPLPQSSAGSASTYRSAQVVPPRVVAAAAAAPADDDEGGVGSDSMDLPATSASAKWTPNPNAIRSPFAVTAQGTRVRNGSPLPQPRRNGTSSSTGGPAAAQSGARPTAGSAAYSSPGSGSGYGAPPQAQASSAQTLRYASPQAIPTFSQAQAQSQVARTSSPMARRAVGQPAASTGATVGRNSSPMPASGGGSSGGGGIATANGPSTSSTAVRRANSPMARPTVLPNAHATISHETIRAMTQPPQRQFAPQGGSSASSATLYQPPTSSTTSSAYGSANAYGRQPVARTSSPMTQQRRTSSPLSHPVSSSGGVGQYQRTSSPMQQQQPQSRLTTTQRTDSPTRLAGYNSPRQTTSSASGVSLAEQYLGMGGSGASSANGAGNGASARLSRDTNASIMRRTAGGTIAAHR